MNGVVRMEIGKCIVTDISKEELYDVETVCFARDIIWCGSGRKHTTYYSYYKTIIVREEQKYIATTNYPEPEYPHYTAKEFIKKFGKTNKTKKILLNDSLYKNRKINLDQNN